jgi:hypothetical protein
MKEDSCTHTLHSYPRAVQSKTLSTQALYKQALQTQARCTRGHRRSVWRAPSIHVEDILYPTDIHVDTKI